MKRIIRCICLTLVFAMVLSTGAIAADATKQNESETVSFLVDNYDEAQIAQDTYANLSPEANSYSISCLQGIRDWPNIIGTMLIVLFELT